MFKIFKDDKQLFGYDKSMTTPLYQTKLKIDTTGHKNPFIGVASLTNFYTHKLKKGDETTKIYPPGSSENLLISENLGKIYHSYSPLCNHYFLEKIIEREGALVFKYIILKNESKIIFETNLEIDCIREDEMPQKSFSSVLHLEEGVNEVEITNIYTNQPTCSEVYVILCFWDDGEFELLPFYINGGNNEDLIMLSRVENA